MVGNYGWEVREGGEVGRSDWAKRKRKGKEGKGKEGKGRERFGGFLCIDKK